MRLDSHVVVIGAGIVGAATAYYLAQAAVRVTVIDAEHPAWGASGRNAGYLWLHTRADGVQMELALAGRRLYDELAEQLDDFEFRPGGGMIYFFGHQSSLFPAFVENRRAAGLPMQLLDPQEACDICPILPADIGGATYNPLDGHVNPEKVTRSLLAGAERAGATFRPGTRALDLDVSGGRCHGVRTQDGGIGADVVVVAAGVWSPTLLEPLGLTLPIVPMRLQVAETAHAPVRFAPVLYGPTALKQYAFTKDLPGYVEEHFTHPLERAMPGLEMLELVAQRKDGRIVIGCPMDFPGYDDRPTVGGLALTCGILGDHLPALRDLAINRTWAGLLPQTPDALPVLGPVEGCAGLVLATGHVFGVIAGPLSGRLVAQQLTGQPTDLDLTPFRYERESLSDLVSAHRHW